MKLGKVVDFINIFIVYIYMQRLDWFFPVCFAWRTVRL